MFDDPAGRVWNPDRSSLHRHGHGHAATAGDQEASHLPQGVDPRRIVIPAIGVDADAIDLGLRSDGAMEVPEGFSETRWFAPGPKPGRVGRAVIAGHVDSRSGPAVFFRLQDLGAGQEIEVNGQQGDVVIVYAERVDA